MPKARQPAATMTTAQYRQMVDADTSEADFQAEVLKAATAAGWTFQYHTHDSRRSAEGWPDLVLLHPLWHRVMVRELKTAAGPVTDAQFAWITELQRCGIDADIWRPTEWDRIAAELGGQQ